MPGTLYIVATPIGNIEEITIRALEVLSEVDLIAAEDTRTTGLMLDLLGKKAPKFTAYHKLNEAKKHKALIKKLQEGLNIALVTDAGTPCISDPGYLLVKAAVDADITVVGVSGPCAAITALCISGLPAEPFLFVGFLPRKESEIIEAMNRDSTSVVFYESPKRVIGTLAILAENFPTAAICLCNDMTKKFEMTYRGAPEEVLKQLQSNPNAEKGEYTGVFYWTDIPTQEEIKELPSLESLLVDIIVKSGDITLKDAVGILSESGTHAKNEVYAASLRLKEILK